MEGLPGGEKDVTSVQSRGGGSLCYNENLAGTVAFSQQRCFCSERQSCPRKRSGLEWSPVWEPSVGAPASTLSVTTYGGVEGDGAPSFPS